MTEEKSLDSPETFHRANYITVNDLNPITVTENYEAVRIIYYDEHIDKVRSGHQIWPTETLWDPTSVVKLNFRAQKFTILHSCIDFIAKMRDEEFIFVTSVLGAKKILPAIHHVQSLLAVMVFNKNSDKYMHLKTTYNKIYDVFDNQEALVSAIKNVIKFSRKNISLDDIIFLPNLARSEMWTKEIVDFFSEKLLLETWGKIEAQQNEKQNLIRFWKDYIGDNAKEFADLIQFEKNYEPNQALNWYTKDTILYQTLNKALRTDNIDVISTFRFFMMDIFQDLTMRMIQTPITSQLKLYRGLQLNDDTIKKLNKHAGHLISCKGFLSTSRKENVALNFAEKQIRDPSIKGALRPVVWEIIVNPGVSAVLANIADVSAYPDEEEFLFGPNTTFIIDTVEEYMRGSQMICTVKMILTDTMEPDFAKYKEMHSQEIKLYSPVAYIGRIISYQMNENTKSKAYLNKMIHALNMDPQSLQSELGDMHMLKGEIALEEQVAQDAKMSYQTANKCYLKARNTHELYYSPILLIKALIALGKAMIMTGKVMDSLEALDNAEKEINRNEIDNNDLITEIQCAKADAYLKQYEQIDKNHSTLRAEQKKNAREQLEKAQINLTSINGANKEYVTIEFLRVLAQLQRSLGSKRKYVELLKNRLYIVEQYLPFDRSLRLSCIRSIAVFYSEEYGPQRAEAFINQVLDNNTPGFQIKREVGEIYLGAGFFSKACSYFFDMEPINQNIIENCLEAFFYSTEHRPFIKWAKTWLNYLTENYVVIDERRGHILLKLAVKYQLVNKPRIAKRYIEMARLVLDYNNNRLFLRTIEDIQHHWKSILGYEFHIANIVCQDRPFTVPYKSEETIHNKWKS